MEADKVDKRKMTAVITAQTELCKGIYSMWMRFAGEDKVAERAVPGQFISMYSKQKSRMLPRPISICEIDRNENMLRVVYRVAGEGTLEFSQMKSGDTIEVVGPLGNGFTKEDGRAVVIGGGIGIPPMLQLAKELHGNVQAVLGYRDTLFLQEEFKSCADIYIATEDGSAGTKGNVIDAMKENGLQADIIYACGPKPMLRGIREYANENGIRAQISMEERMACGIGACLACVCESRDMDGHSHVYNKRICKDGPVFDVNEVVLD